MKKLLVVAILVLLSVAMMMNAQESKKILNIKKAYLFMEEQLLINETDLNCSYFIKEAVPQDIRIVDKHVLSAADRAAFTDHDELIINKGSKDGLKEGDLLMIMSKKNAIDHPRNHDRLGHLFLKKSLAAITCIYPDNAVIALRNGCHPVFIGDFAILYKPEGTLFQKKIDYKYCRIPTNAVSGMVVFTELTEGIASVSAGGSQYVTADLGEGVVGKGTFLLFYRELASDLPPLIIGVGIVIHSEKTNSTVKVLDASTGIQVRDRVLILPGVAEAAQAQAGKETIPVVDAAPGEDGQLPVEGEEPGVGQAALNFSILFPFDGKQPIVDHAADFAAIRDFIAGKSEYLVTLRGYACSIGGDEYNLRLSAERVEAIKAVLVGQYGVDASRIESFFYGEKEPLFDNSSEVERRKNRLVKIEVNGQ